MIGRLYYFYLFMIQALEGLVWSVVLKVGRHRNHQAVSSLRLDGPASISLFHQGGIGNGILLSPMLQTLRAVYPKSKITLFSWQSQEGELLKAAGLVDETRVVSRSGFLKKPQDSYDLLFSAARTHEGDRVVRHIPAKIKIGFRKDSGWFGQGATYHHISIPITGQEHEAAADYQLLKPIISPLPAIPETLLPARSELLSAQAKKRGAPLRIAIHPGSEKVSDWKRVPTQKMAEAGSQLMSELDAEIVIIAGPDEKEEALCIQKSIGQKAVLFESTKNILDTFKLLRSVDVLVTNDSGVMHLAALAQCPIAAIFGPTNASISGPWGNSSSTRIVSASLCCSPCYRFYSGSLHCINLNKRDCLEKISASQIVNAVKDLLGFSKQ